MSRYVIEKEKLVQNIEILKQKAKVQIIGVVKGNGYGLGIKEFTTVLKENGIKTFAVTEVMDIPVLREILKDEDILVMRSTCLKDEIETIVKYDCTATVGSVESANMLNEISKSVGKTTKAHIKIDTGMGRYGFLSSEIDSIIPLYSLENISFTGIYTHFSSAFTNAELTMAQLEIFKDVVNQLKKEGINVGTMHAANSPALLNCKSDVCLDAVRIGSAFTGRVITKSNIGLNRIGMLEAEIVDVKNLPSGYSVGYNGKFKTEKPTKLAIIPFGHYDGFGIEKSTEEYNLHTVLSTAKKYFKKQKICVTVNGKQFAVAGEIGLSHTAIDITNTDIKVGDTAKADISPLFVNPQIERIYI